jgi:SAM-dependent methyltransferase
MGTAQVQGSLWGARARDYADIVEGCYRPVYARVFTEAGVGAGTKLLDVGCGQGLAAQLAAQRGAQVAGLDAAEASLGIARERTPAGDFRAGEMEDLPWPDNTFDVVTGFNAFQYAADLVNALREAGRVARPGGRVAMAVWGRAEDCETVATISALGKLLPPPPPGAPGPFALSAPGRVEGLLQQAGLAPLARGEVWPAARWTAPSSSPTWRRRCAGTCLQAQGRPPSGRPAPRRCNGRSPSRSRLSARALAVTASATGSAT